jgi:hypothetical protein
MYFWKLFDKVGPVILSEAKCPRPAYWGHVSGRRMSKPSMSGPSPPLVLMPACLRPSAQ